MNCAFLVKINLIIINIIFKGVDAILVHEINMCPLNATVSKVSSGALEIIEIYSIKNVDLYF